ncbi:MAG TPA: peptidoglycan binding domain-containing protein, partial [Candidatus Limnocylindrales bacterium]
MTTATETELPAQLESSRRMGWLRILMVFVLGLGLALVLAVGGVLAYEQAHAGKIGQGVHVGSVDLSGLTRDQAAAKLTAAYDSLSQGQLTFKLPDGASTVSYADLGRKLDVDAVVDAALAVGRTGNPLIRVSDEIRTAIKGTNIAPVVTFDQAALNKGIARVAAAVATVPVNATIQSGPSGYVGTTSSDGRTLVTDSLAGQVMTELGALDAPAQQTIDVSASLVPVKPTVSSASAATVAAGANADVAPIVLSHQTNSWTIPAATVASWLEVQVAPDGTYMIQANPAKVTASLTALAAKINRKAVNATFLISKRNKVVGVVPGQDGRTLDVAGSVSLIESLLSQRASGLASSAPITPAILTSAPSLSTAAATSAAPQMKAISSWTTYYAPGAHNGNSANITIPAMAIDGTVVAPGAKFDFWKSVGVVSLAKGYKLGGAIINGHSVEGKTIGGGICST